MGQLMLQKNPVPYVEENSSHRQSCVLPGKPTHIFAFRG